MKCLTTFVALALLSGCSAILGADFDHPAASSDGTLPDGGSELPNGEGEGGAAGPDAARTEDGGCAWADCKTPRPSNVGTFGHLPVSGSALTLVNSASFNTTNDCKAGSILGECGPVLQTEGPAVCVCRVDTITIQDLKVTGARGLVLFAHGTVTIEGSFDMAATGQSAGPGAEPPDISPGQSGLFEHGTADLVPLRGGMGAIAGSAGGGALQVSSGTSIVIGPKGTLQAGGGGGAGNAREGRSAGSGGAILLEAPLVQIEGQLLANGGGGGGGGDGSNAGDHGQDARQGWRTAAKGGSSRDGNGCALSGYTDGGKGGNGGAEGVLPESGEDGDVRNCIPERRVYAGGDGGGVGRIRINVASEASVQSSPTSFVSPAASRGIMALD